MQKNWLKNQLTKVKRTAPMWVELSTAIQQIADDHAAPLIERLRNIKSSFTMAEADLDKRIDELGRFFAIRAVPAEIKPIVYMQRLDEIHLKDTVLPLENTLLREFGGLSVKWEAFYAPTDLKKHPYGTVFLTAEDIFRSGGIYGDVFLTSRGVIRLSLNEIMRNSPSDDANDVVDALVREIRVYVEPLLPLHIVFDGTRLEIRYTLKEAEEYFIGLGEAIGQTEAITKVEAVERIDDVLDSVGSSVRVDLLAGSISHADFIARYDDIPLDCWTLDSGLLPFYHDTVISVYPQDRSITTIDFTATVPPRVTEIAEHDERMSRFIVDAGGLPVEVSEEVTDHLVPTANNSDMAVGAIAEVTDLASVIRSEAEYNNAGSMLENGDTASVTTSELNDSITGINQAADHSDNKLHFDNTPLDQCMLDSGNFEP